MVEAMQTLPGERNATQEAGGHIEISVQPPIPFVSEDSVLRQARLADLAARDVIPRLLALHSDILVRLDDGSLHAGQDEISELSRLLLGPDNPDALNYINMLRDRGLSLDVLHAELLEPTARYLGELWNQDRIDFVDVTIGVSKLQRFVHLFAGLDQVAPYDEKRRALITTTPGDQHSFGNSIVQKFMRAGGWHVHACTAPKLEDVSSVVEKEWFGVIGFSVSADVHLEGLALAIRRVRETSLNRTVGIMVGGPCFVDQPQRVAEVGADGTAVNGPTAVILAKKLLVPSLGG